MVKQRKKLFLNGSFLLLVTIALTVALKVFVFASFRVPTLSMEPALVPGDFVLVWKPTLGQRMYRLPGYLRGEHTAMTRRQGLRDVRRNDVLVFNVPYSGAGGSLSPDWNTFFVKRCVAIPGDTFRIENGIYKVRGIADTLGTYRQQVQLSRAADSAFPDHVFRCYPDDAAFQWNIKCFGPLYVPGKGDTMAIDTPNIVLYRNLITYETGKEITVRDGLIYLDDERLTSYTFTKDYCFMAGDHVFNSRDSRYWGLLPVDLVVGKAAFIWKSVDPHTKKIRWNRFFKSIQ